MDVTAPVYTGSAPSTPTASSSDGGASGGAKGGASAISSDFTTFLKMLTAQMQNQDPLNPLDSTDFAVQLATFSNVEQQVRTNELLEGLSSRMGLSGLTDMAGWVGLEARVDGPVRFDGTPVDLSLSVPGGSREAELVVTDTAGAEVQRLPITLPLPDGPVTWSGTTADGTVLPAGSYSFAVEGFSAGEPMGSRPAESYVPVAEVRMGDAGAQVVLSDGSVREADGVTGLREPA